MGKYYTDVLNGDELISDSFKNFVEGEIFLECDGELVNVGGGIDESLIGGNASAEGGDEGTEDGPAKEINVIANHRLCEVPFDKKSFTVYIKGFMKKIKAYLQENKPDEVAPFMAGAPAAVKQILGMMKDLQFYTGESMDADAGIVYQNYREDGMTPYFFVFKHGLKENKM